MDILDLTIKELRQQLVDKKISVKELVDFYLMRIDRYDGEIKSYLKVTEDMADRSAESVDNKIKAGDKLSPLAGLPASIKDVIVTKDIVSTGGSKILENYVPPYDATVVKKLKAQHYILLGKNNCDEFAQGSSTENSGFGPSFNPWDLSRVPGGSSGGSAVAVAAGLAHYSLGSDTGGSIRQPASFCSVVGLKPTYGRVSRYGLMAMASSLDQIGVLARRVEDVARVLKIIEGEDVLDATSTRNNPSTRAKLGAGHGTNEKTNQREYSNNLKGLKVGIPKEYFGQGLDRQVEQIIKKSIDQLAELGAEVKEISLPYADYALATYYIIMMAEVSSNMAKYEGIRYGESKISNFKFQISNLEDLYKINRSEFLGDEVKRRIMLGTYVLSAGYYDQYYARAQKVRRLIRDDFARAFEEVDLIAGPVAPTPAFKLGEKIADPLQMYLSDIYTVPVNLAGLPALSVPAGFSGKKEKKDTKESVQDFLGREIPESSKKNSIHLPVGLHLIGKWWEDYQLLQAAEVFEQATEYYKIKPTL